VTTLRSSRRPRRKRILGVLAAVLAVAGLICTNASALHLFGSVPTRIYPAQGKPLPIAAVMVSGDMGFGHGMSLHFAQALAQRGVTVVGVVAPYVFAQHRTLPQARYAVEHAMLRAMQLTGAQSLILVGQSYGADIVATVAPQLPASLMRHVAAIDLMVPGRYVYFRADTSGLAYLGKPDALPAAALNQTRKRPLVCIYGVEEDDSLCPLVTRPAKVIGLPGGHHLEHNHELLVETALGALHAYVPELKP